MKVLLIFGLIHVGAACSVPGVATITVKNKTSFPIITEYKMGRSDGNKSGRVVTQPGDDKNHDFTYKHDPLSEPTDNQKQEISFLFEGNFFHYTVSTPAAEVEEIRWQGEGVELQSVIIAQEALEGLSSADITKKFQETDERLLVYKNDEESTSVYISADSDVGMLELGLSDIDEDDEIIWSYVKMERTSDVFINSKEGHDIVQKTYICKIDRCYAD